MRVVQLVALTALVALFASSLEPSSAQSPRVVTAAGLGDLSLVITHQDTDPHDAQTLFESVGGRVAVIVPPRCIVGWISSDRDVSALEGVGRLHRTPVWETSRFDDPATRAVVDFFNEALNGTGAAALETSQLGSSDTGPDVSLPTISIEEVKRNLRTALPEFAPALQALDSRPLTQNSEYMTGTVWVSVFFVESDGSGTDPDLYDWTEATEQESFVAILSALTWWSLSAQSHADSDCWVAFYVKPYFATSDPRCWQANEPILHTGEAFLLSVHHVLENFGFTSGSSVDRSTAFNFSQRNVWGTDWAYSAFIAASTPGLTSFAGGFAGRAFIGGPHFVQVQQFGGSADRVFAHETAHMFGACDEYRGSCTCSGCANGVENGNCFDCTSQFQACLMATSSWELCPWTPGHVGWERTPCAPQPLPPPVLDAVSPPAMEQGATGFVGLTGSNFSYGMQSDFGPGVQVLSERFFSNTSILVELSVDPDAAVGPRDIVITTRDLHADTLQAGFAVVNQTDIQLQTFSLRYEAGRGAILEWELQRDGGEKGTLIVLRAQDAQPRAWHELTRLTLEERGFADDTVDVGSWAYALMLETKKSTHLLADDVILVGAPQPHLSLLGNRPNPFNPSTRIRFRLASAAPVDVRIFDLRGRLVRQLQATSPAGEGSIVWDGKDHAGRPQPSGTYIYEVIVEGGAAVARMTLLR